MMWFRKKIKCLENFFQFLRQANGDFSCYLIVFVVVSLFLSLASGYLVTLLLSNMIQEQLNFKKFLLSNFQLLLNIFLLLLVDQILRGLAFDTCFA